MRIGLISAGGVDNLPVNPALRAGCAILLRDLELIAALDHHPLRCRQRAISPLCFRFIILFTMLRQTFNVPLPEDIPDQKKPVP